MKRKKAVRIFAIIVFILAVIYAPIYKMPTRSTDLEKVGLKGPVQSVSLRRYKLQKKGFKKINRDILSIDINEYTPDGNLDKAFSYLRSTSMNHNFSSSNLSSIKGISDAFRNDPNTTKRQFIKKRDSKGRVIETIEEITYGESERFVENNKSSTKYVLDDQGNTIKKSYYFNGSLTKTDTFQYDGDRLRIESTDSNGKVSYSSKEFTRDHFDNLFSATNFGHDGRGNITRYIDRTRNGGIRYGICKYKYDSYDNWTVKRTSAVIIDPKHFIYIDPGWIEYRTIKYHKN